jgi:hypothetical protein
VNILLLNEIVIIFRALNRLYYTRKIGLSPKITNHAMFGLKEEISPAQAQQDPRPSDYEKTKGTAQGCCRHTPQSPWEIFYRCLEGIYPTYGTTKGDIVLEGRTGQSIRFGAAWKTGTLFSNLLQGEQSPNIVIQSRAKSQSHSVRQFTGNFGLVSPRT